MKKNINQEYFDLEKLTENELKRRHYTLGASYSGYNPQGYGSFTFRFRDKGLVKLVHDELESEHTIIRDKRTGSSYWFEARGKPVFYSKLKIMGLVKDKSKRAFPRNFKRKYLEHSARGFFDVKARIYIKDGRTNILIQYRRKFLQGLHNALVKYAGLEPRRMSGDVVSYGHKDAEKIHDFIYNDWKFIKRTKLYVPSKKKKFKPYFEPIYPASAKSFKKIEKALWLLLVLPIERIAKHLDYSSRLSFHRAFKFHTGMAPVEYLEYAGIRGKGNYPRS